jgi:hypothetical protein
MIPEHQLPLEVRVSQCRKVPQKGRGVYNLPSNMRSFIAAALWSFDSRSSSPFVTVTHRCCQCEVSSMSLRNEQTGTRAGVRTLATGMRRLCIPHLGRCTQLPAYFQVLLIPWHRCVLRLCSEQGSSWLSRLPITAYASC